MRKKVVILIVIVFFGVLLASLNSFFQKKLLQSDNEIMCSIASNIIVIQKDDKGVGLLVDTLENNKWGCRFKAMKALEKIGGTQVVREIENKFSKKNSIAKWHMILILEKINSQDSMALIVSALSDNDESIRAEAARCLGDLKAHGAADRLRYLVLNDKSDLVRSEAAVALAKSGDHETKKILISYLDNDTLKIKINSVIGLAFIKNDSDVIPALVGCLRKNNNYDLRYLCIKVLRRLTSESIEKLTGKSEDFWLKNSDNSGKTLYVGNITTKSEQVAGAK